MSIDRREFLRIAGLAGVGIGLSATSLLWRNRVIASEFVPAPESLVAERWAMVIDLRKYEAPEDYQRLISACHSVHNVPDIDDKKDEVKWIWTDTFEHAFPGQHREFIPESIERKPFLLLCNHCDNPPCVRVCPTKATFKRQDGIVMMDQHRCIGCRFCMAACPYGARSFNWRDPRPFIKKRNPEFPTRTIGVVEKCTFCAERLPKGLRPACVDESEGALAFGDLRDPRSEVRKLLSTQYAVRRKQELGTQPSIFYIIGGDEHAG
jgi:molybdopterin-containing oxidoreductase family iron-sulfur binding subunit